MSEVNQEEKKTARVTVENLQYDSKLHTVSFKATLLGNIQQGKKTDDKGIIWQEPNARTIVTAVNVPVREFIVKVMAGWFWVRKIQDVLRKGTKGEALARLARGYDWTEETTKSATPASPVEQGQRLVARTNTLEELQAIIAAAQAKAAELEAKERAEKAA